MPEHDQEQNPLQDTLHAAECGDFWALLEGGRFFRSSSPKITRLALTRGFVSLIMSTEITSYFKRQNVIFRRYRLNLWVSVTNLIMMRKLN